MLWNAYCALRQDEVTESKAAAATAALPKGRRYRCQGGRVSTVVLTARMLRERTGHVKGHLSPGAFGSSESPR